MNTPGESNDARLPSPRIQAARLALQGLSIGDAFGQQFFSSAVWHQFFQGKQLPLPVWHYTDDTVMALSILETLERHERIDQDQLAGLFLERFSAEPNRGYGAGLARLMRELERGGDWRLLSRTSFDGAGSFGNGAAMRVAPVGAFFAENWHDVIAQARLSAEVTHAHPDGIAGAIAVAVAAAWTWRWRKEGQTEPPSALLETVARLTPEGAIRDGIRRALEIPLDDWEHTAANALGNGERITAADTVPFCLWCAAAHLDDFCEGLLAAVRVRGDIDTNCAIIGGILALAVTETGLPQEWLRRRESLATARSG
jgi:ADP-ribosylglycohydrolase